MKRWHKYLLLNVVGAGLVALEASFSLLEPTLPVNAYAALGVTLAVANAMLRVTLQAIAKNVRP